MASRGLKRSRVDPITAPTLETGSPATAAPSSPHLSASSHKTDVPLRFPSSDPACVDDEGLSPDMSSGSGGPAVSHVALTLHTRLTDDTITPSKITGKRFQFDRSPESDGEPCFNTDDLAMVDEPEVTLASTGLSFTGLPLNSLHVTIVPVAQRPAVSAATTLPSDLVLHILVFLPEVERTLSCLNKTWSSDTIYQRMTSLWIGTAHARLLFGCRAHDLVGLAPIARRGTWKGLFLSLRRKSDYHASQGPLFHPMWGQVGKSFDRPVSPNSRRTLIDWIVEVLHDLCPGRDGLIHNAVHMIDVYTLQCGASRTSFQLVGAAAVIRALRMENIHIDNINERMSLYTAGSCSPRDIRDMFRAVCDVLGPMRRTHLPVMPITVHSFLSVDFRLEHFFKAEQPPEDQLRELYSPGFKLRLAFTCKLTRFISLCGLSLCESNLVPASVRAASALALACHTQQLPQEWVRCVYENYGYTLRELLPTMSLLLSGVHMQLMEAPRLHALVDMCGYPVILPTTLPDIIVLSDESAAPAFGLMSHPDGTPYTPQEQKDALSIVRWRCG